MNTRMRKSGEIELRTTGHEGRACNAETPQAGSLKAGGNTEALEAPSDGRSRPRSRWPQTIRIAADLNSRTERSKQVLEARHSALLEYGGRGLLRY